jgi:beta-glucosidase
MNILFISLSTLLLASAPVFSFPWKNFLKYSTVFSAGVYSGQKLFSSDLNKLELRYNWDTINKEDITFPEDFILGAATAAYQIDGGEKFPASNWAHFEKKGTVAEPSHDACDHWNRWEEDIGLLEELGVKAYRFSVEWSAIEPREGEFDQLVIDYYNNLCDALLTRGIMPVITLHHFTHPQWFEEKGAFEKQENITYFVRFCERMFKEIGPKVPVWCTINEPGVYTFMGYIMGDFPPGKNMFMWGAAQLAGEVTKNLALAHKQAYNALKAIPGGERVRIGLVHSITQFEPYHPGNPLETAMTGLLTHLMYDALLQFMITGKLSFYVPGFASVEYTDPGVARSLDFIGLNYYSHVMFNWLNPGAPDYRSGEIPTDMPYGIYAEGLYRAITQVAPLEVPIYITENGIADREDNDWRREEYSKRYLYTLHKAIQDGYDVRGYFYWSLLDNYEWNMGYKQKFGLYEVDFATKKRTLRKGARYFQQVVQNHYAPQVAATA